MKPEIISIAELHQILPSHPVISIAGAGGKTTLMFSLAKKLPGVVVTTTTTKVSEKQILTAEEQAVISDLDHAEPRKSIWVSPSLQPQNGKIHGCNAMEFDKIAEICRKKGWILIAETDGAARRHLKAPADHEPVIPEQCNVCFSLAGLDTIGLPLNDRTVHRPEIFAALTGIKPGQRISANNIACMLDHPHGGLKNMPKAAIRFAYLTHAAVRPGSADGLFIASLLQHYHYICFS